MKQIFLKLIRQLAYYFLNLALSEYTRLADENKNGELSMTEIKKSVKQLIKIKSQFRK